MEILLRKIELMIIFYLKKYVKRKQQFQTDYVSEFKGVIVGSSVMFANVTLLLGCHSHFTGC